MAIIIPVVSLLGLSTILFIAIRARRKFPRKLIYEQAVAKIEGGGIKRGLTPPEAAVVLGRPYSQIATLVILQLLRKNVLEIIKAESLAVRVASKYSFISNNKTAEERANERNLAAQVSSVVLYPYEHLFIEYLDQKSLKTLIEINFDVLLKPFVLHVANRIVGYDFGETRRYYEAIIRRSPVEARTEGKLVFDAGKIVEKNILWILMHENADQLLSEDFRDYLPGWINKENDDQAFENFYDWYGNAKEQIQSNITAKEIGEKLLEASSPLIDRMYADIIQATING
ncbi:MAG: hypothetical protein N2C13_06550 [Chloroflexota bacterium]